MVLPDRQERAGGQPHQVVGVRHRVGFVEVVDAPDQPAFGVAPGAEVLHVQIADAEHDRGGGQLGADLRPALDPAVERRPQNSGNGLSAIRWCFSSTSAGSSVSRLPSQAS